MREYLRSVGLDGDIREFSSSTKNSALAAEALGCTVGEIAKSVVFVGKGALVVVISGDRRVDPGRLASAAGVPVRVASPEEVREMTGYPIGGVPPFPHRSDVSVLLDASLTRFKSVWAAAGSPNAVFRVSPADLIRIVGRGPLDVAAQRQDI